MKTVYLDRENYGMVYKFIPKPVWFSVSVEVPPDLAKAVPLLAARFMAMNLYLDSLYEAARAGATPPPVHPDIQEIIDQCLAPAVAVPAKKQKQKATAADSNSESPSS